MLQVPIKGFFIINQAWSLHFIDNFKRLQRHESNYHLCFIFWGKDTAPATPPYIFPSPWQHPSLRSSWQWNQTIDPDTDGFSSHTPLHRGTLPFLVRAIHLTLLLHLFETTTCELDFAGSRYLILDAFCSMLGCFARCRSTLVRSKGPLPSAWKRNASCASIYSWRICTLARRGRWPVWRRWGISQSSALWLTQARHSFWSLDQIFWYLRPYMLGESLSF